LYHNLKIRPSHFVHCLIHRWPFHPLAPPDFGHRNI
jgi:hypothetical protein